MLININVTEETTIEDILLPQYERIYEPHRDISDDAYKNRTRISDWRKYIGDYVDIKDWPKLSENTRKCIAVLCNEKADLEDWDW